METCLVNLLHIYAKCLGGVMCLCLLAVDSDNEEQYAYQ